MRMLSKFKHYLPVTIIVMCILGVLLLYICGFRIVYNPRLENSWNAISACAAWASGIASFAAAIIAIHVPQQVADEQNKIALFEKRFECYSAVQTFLVCASQIENAKTNKEVQVAFRIYFDRAERIEKDVQLSTIIILLEQKQGVALSGAFLFSIYNVDMILEIIKTSIELITAVNVDGNQVNIQLSELAISKRNKFVELCQNFETNYIPSMEKDMKISG